MPSAVINGGRACEFSSPLFRDCREDDGWIVESYSRGVFWYKTIFHSQESITIRFCSLLINQIANMPSEIELHFTNILNWMILCRIEGLLSLLFEFERPAYICATTPHGSVLWITELVSCQLASGAGQSAGPAELAGQLVQRSWPVSCLEFKVAMCAGRYAISW